MLHRLRPHHFRRSAHVCSGTFSRHLQQADLRSFGSKGKKDEEEDSNESGSLIGKLWKWANRTVQEMEEKRQFEPAEKLDKKAANEEQEKWTTMWAEIKESNAFDPNIDPRNFKERTTYEQITRSEFMHKAMMKINYYPLKYPEFMVGAHQGMEFILQCLEQNDMDGIRGVVDERLMDKVDELKGAMLDDNYNSVGKVMCFLDTVNNGPNFSTTSISAQYFVRYYYQLKKPNNSNESDAKSSENEQDDNGETSDKFNDDFIVKRCDLTWASTWLPIQGWTFRISDEGWKVADIECVDIERAQF